MVFSVLFADPALLLKCQVARGEVGIVTDTEVAIITGNVHHPTGYYIYFEKLFFEFILLTRFCERHVSSNI